MRRVNKDSPIPIYAQLQEIITEMIDNEELQAHDPIPTEHELCKVHEISRMTVRAAITTLVNEGVLYRKQGKGTFVAERKPKYQLSGLKGLTEGMEELGYRVDTKTLSFQHISCSKKIASIISKEKLEEAIQIKRLRFVNDEPYAIETVWLHPNKCPNLTEEMVKQKSLYEVLRKEFRLIPHYSKQTVEPIRLNEFEKEIFNLADEPLGLLFNRTTFNVDDEVIEYTGSVYRIDKHKFEMTLKM